MKNLNVVLVTLHDQIDFDRRNLITLLGKIEALYPQDPLPEYTRYLYLNYIYLSELSYSIKEYFILKDILIHKF
jgi:hypothetical protein